MTDGPPHIDREKLDFSQLHQLDHHIFSERCRSLPGGWRRHLAVSWKYVWKDELLARTRCRVGRHRFTQGWRRVGPDAPWVEYVSCRYCGLRKRRDEE